MSYRLKIIVAVLFLFSTLAASWAVLHGDILFHTDIARDFLLLEDVVLTHKPVLIGPRSGGIPGVFHGPLWLYINLPAFILGGGNPVVVGWFWVLLTIFSVYIVYFVGKKLFDSNTGILSALLFSIYVCGDAKNLFNPFGAVMLFPLFLYLFYKYISNTKLIYLVSCFFVIGLIIQFQMAFGMPILFLTVVYLAVFLTKKKKLHHFVSLLILLLPLSTYILFEMRHDFLQVKSVLKFISGVENSGKMPIQELIPSRIKGMFVDGWGLLPGQYWFLTLLAVGSSALILYRQYKLHANNLIYTIFAYYYFGYWVIAFFFRGVIWGYYYWPFLPVVLIMLVSLHRYTNKRYFTIAFSLLYCFMLVNTLQGIRDFNRFSGKDGGSWKFNVTLAQDVYSKADNEFGYYIFTPDLFGYSQNYAFRYVQKQSHKKAYSFQKKKDTFLIISSAPQNRPELDGKWWKTNQVKINMLPREVIQYKGMRVERYQLSNKDIDIQSDPNLLNSIYFR